MGEEDKGWLNSDHMATWLYERSHQGLLLVTVALWNWDERGKRTRDEDVAYSLQQDTIIYTYIIITESVVKFHTERLNRVILMWLLVVFVVAFILI